MWNSVINYSRTVLLVVSHLPVTYIGIMIFASIFRIQHGIRILENQVYLEAFSLSSAQLMFLGLTVMAWEILKWEMVSMLMLWPTL